MPSGPPPRRRPPLPVQLKSNIDDAACFVDGFIVVGPLLAGSRCERDLSASDRTPSRTFSDVANNAVIAVGENDGRNQMSVIAQHAYCLHLISSVYVTACIAIEAEYLPAVSIISMQ